MRILAMYHAYPPHHNAGAEWDAHTLLKATVEAGHEVDVQLSQPIPGVTRDFALDGVNVHVHRDKRDPFRWLGSADVIVTHLENTPRATILGQQARTPVVHRLHNTFKPTRRWLEAPGVSLAVANSEWMAEEMRVPKVPMLVVRPPVAPADYATKPGDKVTIVNLFENKGGLQFWRIAEALPDVEFLAVKGGYGEQVIPDEIPANVELVDNTPRMRDEVYARTKILLMPSDYESWGRVGVEAMASGIPVIAHPTEGLTESLGDAGIFIDRDDTGAWAAEIGRLLKPRAWSAASKKAKARSGELDPSRDLATWVAALSKLSTPRR
jgi:glycosyltransferase involved in cell wall biosynthesis